MRSAPIVSRSSMSGSRSEEHTSELQSPCNLVCRLLLEKKKTSLSRSDSRWPHKLTNIPRQWFYPPTSLRRHVQLPAPVHQHLIGSHGCLGPLSSSTLR